MAIYCIESFKAEFEKLIKNNSYSSLEQDIIDDENLYLMFVHPKTGSHGFDNITDESKTYLYKTVLASIKSKDYYEVKTEKNKLVFSKYIYG